MPPPRKPADVSQKERNEYIPNFISKKPFYVTEDSTAENDYLEHQRLQTGSEEADRKHQSKWYDRGKKIGPAATKYRKGACDNCGAMTHKTKECLSRPRKHGAKWTGADIQADEIVQDLRLGWDAKRDRWNGYDATQHNPTTEEFDAQKDAEGDPSNEDEGARYEEETDMGRQQATSTRNLRIREDTAKYLLNLDLDSAKYDPKTRSMVDSGATQDQAAALVAEEGFMKASGDAAEFESAQRYAWESQERGDKNKVHLQANPTAGAYLQKKDREVAEAKRIANKKALLDKYGGQEMFTAKPAEIAVTEKDQYVEYDERGRIKNKAPVKAKSQYPEDVLINNHTAVWGSWWRDFNWGYACCYSTVKNSYCTGEDGKRALEQENQLSKAKEAEQVPKEIAWEEEASLEQHVPNGAKDDASHQSVARVRKRAADSEDVDDSDAALEAYRRKRVAAGDPMASHLGRDELLT